uniref:Aa_trans domain-containing protein n=1 Tax=Steinernema glaseri TaxID=37863 RepID=A0A1I7Y1N4_9BILA
MHVRLATTCIAIFCAFLGGIIPVANFLDGAKSDTAGSGLMNLVVGIMAIYGADKLRPPFLYPLIVQCVISTGILCVFLIFNIVYLIDYSFYMDHIDGFPGNASGARER